MYRFTHTHSATMIKISNKGLVSNTTFALKMLRISLKSTSFIVLEIHTSKHMSRSINNKCEFVVPLYTHTHAHINYTLFYMYTFFFPFGHSFVFIDR